MRIRALAIENFRSIRYVKIENIGESILIAGPNGCGKTQIYNAIRLLKSAYGEYQPNELKQWFDESNIRFDKSMDGIDRLFQDTSKPIHISAKFELTDGECDFLRTGSERHVRSRAWESLVPGIHSETNEVRPPS